MTRVLDALRSEGRWNLEVVTTPNTEVAGGLVEQGTMLVTGREQHQSADISYVSVPVEWLY